MIGRIKGTIIEKSLPYLLIDASGTGYEIQTSLITFSQLPAEGSVAVLYTHLSVREDAHLLYGFHSKSERELFRELIKISGVGPKLALSILSVLNEKTLVMCVQEQNVSMLTRIPGVGKKTAARLLVEMEGRLKNLNHLNDADTNFSLTNTVADSNQQAITDAVNALISLGYKQPDASRAVNKIKDKTTLASDQLIRQALQAMV
ncbi:MAG: Holliday junction branch migration protein RuvA [Endozoicomonadaceae bacterium]|nr:Holliday junction branch migration protein RuvA [Endozoicomonadaceae bacterium]